MQRRLLRKERDRLGGRDESDRTSHKHGATEPRVATLWSSLRLLLPRQALPPFYLTRATLKGSIDTGNVKSGTLAPWKAVILSELLANDLKEWIVNRPGKILNPSGGRRCSISSGAYRDYWNSASCALREKYYLMLRRVDRIEYE